MGWRTEILKLIIIMAGGAALAGCMPQGENHSAQNIDGNPGGGGVSAKPSVLCGKNRAVTAVEADGTVRCGASQLAGLIGKSKDAPCFSNEEEHTLTVASAADQLEVPLCDLKKDETSDDVTLGAGPTNEFSCPTGSALVGFSDVGEPLCGSVLGPNMVGVALILPADQCPFGMVDGQLQGTDFSLPLCRYDSASRRISKQTGQRVVKFSNQANTQCPGDKIVVGFDEDHRILCGHEPAQFSEEVPSYITTKFNPGNGFPQCRGQFQSKLLNLTTSAQGVPVDVWVCIRNDLAN